MTESDEGARPTRVIFNPTAGGKRLAANRLDADGVRELFARHGLPVEVCASESADDAVRLAKEAVERGDSTVVAAGGDGTIGTVARAVLDTDVALGILPMGTVMNVPRMLELPRELDPAADVIAGGATRLIDVGEANGTIFFETVSVGISAAMFREADKFEKGDYLTLLRAVRMAFRYRPGRMMISLDDGRTIHTRALMVTIANGPYMGLGMTVAPAAKLDDGKFDVRVFRHFSKFELFRHLLSIAFGRREYAPHVLTERSSAVEIEGRRPLPVRADSRALGSTPLAARVRPKALKVIVPVAESAAARDG